LAGNQKPRLRGEKLGRKLGLRPTSNSRLPRIRRFSTTLSPGQRLVSLDIRLIK
jgi:hypothetical protein